MMIRDELARRGIPISDDFDQRSIHLGQSSSFNDGWNALGNSVMH